MTPELVSAALERLEYDPETGVFRWKFAARGRKAGAVAGKKHGDYAQISLMGKLLKAHRLAFVLMTGEPPRGMVDHINQNKRDNRWANLRVVDMSLNQQNISVAKSNNALGIRGVTWAPRQRKFMARIRVNGALRHIGYFATAELAHDAYLALKREVHPGFSG